MKLTFLTNHSPRHRPQDDTSLPNASLTSTRSRRFSISVASKVMRFHWEELFDILRKQILHFNLISFIQKLNDRYASYYYSLTTIERE